MFPVCMTLCFADLEVLVPEGGVFLPGDTIILLNFKIVTRPFWASRTFESKGKAKSYGAGWGD